MKEGRPLSAPELVSVQTNYASEFSNFASENLVPQGDRWHIKHGERKTGSLSANISLIESPKSLDEYFSKLGLKPVRPRAVVPGHQTTVFTTAGIQVLEDVIHHELPLPATPLFVSQPSVRTQFMDKVGEGTSTSFINLASEIVNPDIKQHFEIMVHWINLLEQLGINLETLTLTAKESEPQWGNLKFRNFVLKVHYQNVEIGDAVYIYGIPQKGRDPLSISDIGFGLDRIRWLLTGESYLGRFKPQGESNWDPDPVVIDGVRTQALLIGSGLKPSNKDAGFQLRQFSKNVVTHASGNIGELSKIFAHNYDLWEIWNTMTVDKEAALQVFLKEAERSFNVLLLNKLAHNHTDIGIDVNLPTVKVLKLLNGTSVGKDELEATMLELTGTPLQK